MTLTRQGIIQENDRYKDEMDRLEKEVSCLRKLHASGGRNTGRRGECFWGDDLVEETILAPSENKAQTQSFRTETNSFFSAPRRLCLLLLMETVSRYHKFTSFH